MLLYNIFHMLIQVFNPSLDVDCSFFAPQLKYKEHYNKNVKGQWCETPYFEVANARVAMENLSDVISGSFIKSSIFPFTPVFLCHWQSPLFLYRDDTRSTTKTRKTKFISCRQTRPCMTHTRSLVLLPVRWAHKAHAHTRTHMHKQILGYFYRSYLMRKTRQRGDPCLRAESMSQHSTLTRGSFCFT